jgi:hypothetical protein
MTLASRSPLHAPVLVPQAHSAADDPDHHNEGDDPRAGRGHVHLDDVRARRLFDKLVAFHHRILRHWFPHIGNKKLN